MAASDTPRLTNTEEGNVAPQVCPGLHAEAEAREATVDQEMMMWR